MVGAPVFRMKAGFAAATRTVRVKRLNENFAVVEAAQSSLPSHREASVGQSRQTGRVSEDQARIAFHHDVFWRADDERRADGHAVGADPLRIDHPCRVCAIRRAHRLIRPPGGDKAAIRQRDDVRESVRLAGDGVEPDLRADRSAFAVQRPAVDISRRNVGRVRRRPPYGEHRSPVGRNRDVLGESIRRRAGVRPRRLADPRCAVGADIQRNRRRAGEPTGIRDREIEAIGAPETGIWRIGEAPIRIDLDHAVGGVVHETERQARQRVIDVRCAQHAGRQPVNVHGRIGGQSDRRVVDARHIDDGRGDALAPRRILDHVTELRRTVEITERRKGQFAVVAQRHAAALRIEDVNDRKRIAVGVAIIRKQRGGVDMERAVFIDLERIVERLRRVGNRRNVQSHRLRNLSAATVGDRKGEGRLTAEIRHRRETDPALVSEDDLAVGRAPDRRHRKWIAIAVSRTAEQERRLDFDELVLRHSDGFIDRDRRVVLRIDRNANTADRSASCAVFDEITEARLTREVGRRRKPNASIGTDRHDAADCIPDLADCEQITVRILVIRKKRRRVDED